MEHAVGFEAGRELGARSILFHQAVANIAGVSVTDLKCLDYIDRVGDVTAGDLARLTGLSTGAIKAASIVWRRQDWRCANEVKQTAGKCWYAYASRRRWHALLRFTRLLAGNRRK